MKKQKSTRQQQTGQLFQTIRLGVKEHIIVKEIDKFYALVLYQTHPHPPKIAILTNHEWVYVFNHKFQLNSVDHKETTLSEVCELKVNLRQEYKLTLLHIKMQYSYNFQCVFMMLSNGHIAVFTDEFYLIGVTQVVCCDPANSIKHSLDFQYYEKEAHRSVRKIKTGLFLFLFSDCLQAHEVEMSSNHKLSKFKPSYKFTLLQLSKTIEDYQIRHPVSLKMFSFFRSQLFERGSEGVNNTAFLSCNCRQEVYFYLINKDTLKMQQIVRISRVQLGGAFVGDCEISPQNKRVLVGLNNGAVRAISYKQESLGTVLYTIKVSPSPIEKIYLQSSEKLLSYSKDCLLSVISLNTLSIQQTFRMGQSSQFLFHNSSHFLSLGSKSPSAYNLQQQQPQSRALILNQFNCDYHKIFQCNADVVSYWLQPERQLVQLSDNSLLINVHKDKKVEVIQTYLPPRSVSVKCIHKNPFSEENQYWILTEKSEIYKYVLSSNNTVSVSDVVQLHRFGDRNGSEHRYIVTFFTFLTRIVPLQCDSQTTQKQYLPNPKSNEELKPLCLGTHTGQILIVSISNMFQIICRMKSLTTAVTNIIELQPHLPKDITKGLILYQSKTSERIIIVEITSHKLPIQLFRMCSSKGWMKQLGKDLLAIMNGSAFNVFYCKEGTNQCQIFKEEHYNPGLIEGSVITVISLCSWGERQYLLVGYSLGQVSIYLVHRNVSEKTYLFLSLDYLIENSKQEPLQFLRYQNSRLTFNLGSFLVWHALPQHQDTPSPPSTAQNHRLSRNKGGRQFNFSQKAEKEKRESIRSLHNISEQLPQGIKLPTLTKPTAKPKKRRSSSLSGLGRDLKPQLMFHFPAIQLYRNLINRSIIH